MQSFLQRIIYAPVSLLQFLRGYIRAIINPLPQLFETATENPVLETRLAAMSQLLAYYRNLRNPEAAYYVGLLSNDEHRHPEFFHRVRARLAFQFAANRGHPGCSTQLALVDLLQSRPGEDLAPLISTIMRACEDRHPQAQQALARAGEYLVRSSDEAYWGCGLSLLEEAAKNDNPLGSYWYARALLDGEILAEDPDRAMPLLRFAANNGVPAAARDLAVTLALFQPESGEPEEIVAWLLSHTMKPYQDMGVEAVSSLVSSGRTIGLGLITQALQTSAAYCVKSTYGLLDLHEHEGRSEVAQALFRAAQEHASRNEAHGHLALAICYQLGIGVTLSLELAYATMGIAYGLASPELRETFEQPFMLLAYRIWQREGANKGDLDRAIQLAHKHSRESHEAQAILRLEDHPTAVHCLPLEALATAPELSSQLALYHLGMEALRRKDLVSAKAWFFALARYHKDYRAMEGLAEVYTILGGKGCAVKCIETARRWRQSLL